MKIGDSRIPLLFFSGNSEPISSRIPPTDRVDAPHGPPGEITVRTTVLII
jgi:hypothetical protein